MISCEDCFEYIPHGRLVMESHPGYDPKKRKKDWWKVVEHMGMEEEIYVCDRTVVWSRGQPTTTSNCTPPLDKNAKNGKLSKQYRSSQSLICCITVESTVKQALFTTFYTYPDKPAMIGEPIADCPTGDPMYSLCILEQEYVTVYTEDGEDFHVSLPFPVERLWSVWFGLLLERKLGSKEDNVQDPLVFSLMHPLEEINPINIKSVSNNSLLPNYCTDTNQSIVMTSLCPSLAVTYHARHKSVSVWRVRRCDVEENVAMVNNCCADAEKTKTGLPSTLMPLPVSVPAFNQSMPGRLIASPTPNFHFTPSRGTSSLLPALHLTPTGVRRSQHSLVLSMTPSFMHSPGVASSLTPHARNSPQVNFCRTVNLGVFRRNSPLACCHFSSPVSATAGHLQSPLLPNVQNCYLAASSPAGIACSSPIFSTRTPVGTRLKSCLSGNVSLQHTCSVTPKQQKTSQGPLFNRTPSPSCLSRHACLCPASVTPRSTIARTPAYLLNESCGEVEPLIPDLCLELLWTDQSLTSPTAAFHVDDCSGQQFLCLLLTVQESFKLVKYEMTNDCTSLVFGTPVTIAAKDAQPLPSLGMIIAVEVDSALVLYTGPVPVCRINVNLPSQVSVTLFKNFSTLNISSDLVCSSSSHALEHPQKLAREEAGTEEKLQDFVAIRVYDAILNRVTMEDSKGQLHRITIPVICSSSLVRRTLSAFKHILPRDVVLNFIAKWYSTRNSPGCGDFSNQGEWLLFSRTLLTSIGYDPDKLPATCPTELSGSCGAPSVHKKAKTGENGSDKDWEYLLASQYHKQNNSCVSEVLQLGWLELIRDVHVDIKNGLHNKSAPLFSYMPAIFFALHLLYEEMKCCTLYWELCALLLPCLSQLAADLRAVAYLHHYWKDFPTICSPKGPAVHLSVEDLTKLSKPNYFTESPPCFQSTIIDIMRGKMPPPFPYIPEVNPLIRSILLIYSVASFGLSLDDINESNYLRRISCCGQKFLETERCIFNGECEWSSIDEKIVLMTESLGFNDLDIQLLSPGLSLLLMNAQHCCRLNPPIDWSMPLYQLINRPDLVKHAEVAELYYKKMYAMSQDAYSVSLYDGFISPACNDSAPDSKDMTDGQDGMESLDWAVLRLRWTSDRRLRDVRQMLNSTTPIKLDVKQRPESSHVEYLEDQKRFLFHICIRTMALPIGRGMFTLSSRTPVITETLPIPALTLTGESVPRGTTVDLSNIGLEVPANMSMWSLFHNGVAAALTIRPSSEKIDTSWIIYNRPKDEYFVEHAGFLLGLGLTGHLKNLSTVGLHEYLSKSHELTTLALLLGVSAARRGTCHPASTKLLSIHLECLLPPTCTEIDIHHTVQVASILGVGLLYQGSGHRHMAEVLLREIGRPPGPEMENSVDRESYSLAAGLGLGLVMFQKGSNSEQFADLDIAGNLYHYIEGGYQKPVTGPTKDKYKSPSYQIKEGKRVNVDVTSPGATLALGMIYFKSHNKSLANWMVTPETTYYLDQIRPDFMLLRTIAYGLIMWGEVVPDETWIKANIPKTLLTVLDDYERTRIEQPRVDYESVYQIYFNLIAGACFAVGLKFAGTANEDAFKITLAYTRVMINYSKNSSVTILAGKSCVESSLVMCLLSLSLVMAGTGDLQVLRIIRFLRERIGPLNTCIGYGSHVATHMALGFLFLGGGRFTLRNDGLAVAALLIACYPKMPHHSLDNRYHLQAFRHLYVLACEPRLVMPVDVDTGRLCRAALTLRFLKEFSCASEDFETIAPVTIPPLDMLQEVVIEGQPFGKSYWPIRFVRGSSSWRVLEALMAEGGAVAVKLREGAAPYPCTEDAPGEAQCQVARPPPGAHELVFSDHPPHWIPHRAIMTSVQGVHATRLLHALVQSQDAVLPCGDSFNEPDKSLMTVALKPDCGQLQQELHLLLASVAYDLLNLGKPEAVASWLSVVQGIKKISELSRNCGLHMWQVKLLHASANFLATLNSRTQRRHAKRKLVTSGCNESSVGEALDVEAGAETHMPRPLLAPDQAISLRSRVVKLLEMWTDEIAPELVRYITENGSGQYSPKTALALLLLDVPPLSREAPPSGQSRLTFAKCLHSVGMSPAVIQSILLLTRTR